MRTTVYGTIYDSSGLPYKGALVKFLPNAPFRSENEWIQDVEVKTVTNSYGRFEVDLPPSTGDNFYFLTVVYDKTTTRPVVIPVSDSPISFLDLEKYLFPHERMEMLGDC
jgi:hypothetical protein